MSVISNGWINMNKMFSTFGIIGIVEAVDILNAKFKDEIKSEDLPDNSKETPDDISNKVIQCINLNNKEIKSNCTEAFIIIPRELAFYKRENIPIPRLCPNCRHYERSRQRNPVKLWHRQCMKEGCQNEFETTYSPERPEIIYCEKCYQAEVY